MEKLNSMTASQHSTKKPTNDLIVGLDIGTSKILVIIGEIMANGELKIIGYGSRPSSGLKKGSVVNIESTVKSIQSAIQEAELMVGCDIKSVYTGIAGSHISSLNSHGIVAIKDNEVSYGDIERVIESARAVRIPSDQKVLHVLPQEYTIDDQTDTKEPIGMFGVSLKVNVHIVTGAVNAIQNITKCVRRCGLEVNKIILEQLASSEAVLTEDEKELGVCMIDIGGGTTDIAIFTNGAIQHTAVIPIAGDQVTNDISSVVRISSSDAEDIKKQYAYALNQLANPDDTIEISKVGSDKTTTIKRQTLSDIAQARYGELFAKQIKEKLRMSGYNDLIPAGIVLTGGGVKMKGVAELAEETLGHPVRVAVPQNVSGFSEIVQNPIYSTGIGLLLFGKKQIQDRNQTKNHPNSFFSDIKKWFANHF